MSRVLLGVFLVAAAATVASAQSQPPVRPDSAVKTVSRGATVTPDTTLMQSRYGMSRPPVPASPVPVPEHRSGICGSIGQRRCALYGAFIGGGVGWVVGLATAPQPVYQSRGLSDLFSEGDCTANCGVTGQTVLLALGGSVLGGAVGWFLGRK